MSAINEAEFELTYCRGANIFDVLDICDAIGDRIRYVAQIDTHGDDLTVTAVDVPLGLLCKTDEIFTEFRRFMNGDVGYLDVVCNTRIPNDGMTAIAKKKQKNSAFHHCGLVSC